MDKTNNPEMGPLDCLVLAETSPEEQSFQWIQSFARMCPLEQDQRPLLIRALKLSGTQDQARWAMVHQVLRHRLFVLWIQRR